MTEFFNAYDDETRADSYDRLGPPSASATYYLAYRDLPGLLSEHVRGTEALDFGSGAGRSTRFLRGLGFDVTGVDISAAMLDRARERDPQGDYRLVPDGDLSSLATGAYDLVLAAFTFDQFPDIDKRVALLRSLRRLLKAGGRLVIVGTTPDLYVNEWASFSTKDFPENERARDGESVKIVILDAEDRRPVEDVLWTDRAYRETFRRAGFELVTAYRPLATASEPYPWVSETTTAPWVIYVLRQ